MGLDSAFTYLSNKIGFIQFGALNRSGLIFEVGYRSVFEFKNKKVVTPSESDLCKFEQNSPNPHRNDSKVPTRHFRAGGKRSNNITQQSLMGPTEQVYITATQRVKNTDIIYKIQITLKTVERPTTDTKQMGLRALKNNQWRP